MGRAFVAIVLLAGALSSACAAGIEDPPATNDPNVGPRHPRSAPITVDEQPPEDTSSPARAPAANTGPLFRAAFDGDALTSLNTFDRDEAALQADGTLTIATKKGWLAADPQPTDYHGGSYYNGGTFRFAVVVSPVWKPKRAFDRVTPSFEALTPPGTWIEIRVSAHLVATGTWTKDYSLGVWAHDAGTVRRHSVDRQKDADGDVRTDTLDLASPADAVQVSVILFSADAQTTPELRAVSASTSLRGAPAASIAGDASVWGKALAVPKIAASDPAWASAASTSMLLGFWGVQLSPAEAATMTSDVVRGGNGNRIFDVGLAPAAANGALHAIVTRLSSLAQLEQLVGNGVPVAIGVSYGAGQLDGAPLASAAAHTLVVTGFAANGRVRVNDPAFATDASVETTYDRAQLAAAWARAGGATYVVWPAGKKLPADPLGGY